MDRTLLHEGGAFEVASAALWLFTSAYAVLGQVPDRRLAGWLAGLFNVFFLRELDFHDWWFDPGLLHVKVLTGAAPLWQKAVSLGAMVGILAVVFAVGWLGIGRFVRALRARDTPAWLLLVAMGCAATSSQLDGLGRTLEPYGIQIDAAV
ncbi:hypothetical protein KUL25_19860 [Rhodobacteraceae bacterium N5(2021)]|uniref:Uncharacterized protein n=1 Tax=Gymnodinialimonas phycosphaerae TaxID=2841589 RepID=A0A975TUG1_9RHOB|nr:hypothetical protein [Gymnodinialimonas phycosphaerae]MBY4895021.1 hypothetical protein [Gymnodinialimonas phycosphaerae]